MADGIGSFPAGGQAGLHHCGRHAGNSGHGRRISVGPAGLECVQSLLGRHRVGIGRQGQFILLPGLRPAVFQGQGKGQIRAGGGLVAARLREFRQGFGGVVGAGQEQAEIGVGPRKFGP